MKRPLFLKAPWNQVLCASLVALLASQCESPDSTSPEPLKDGCFIESVVDGELPSAMRSPSFNTRQDTQVGDRVSISALADLNKDGAVSTKTRLVTSRSASLPWRNPPQEPVHVPKTPATLIPRLLFLTSSPPFSSVKPSARSTSPNPNRTAGSGREHQNVLLPT